MKLTTYDGDVIDSDLVPEVQRRLAVLFVFMQTGSGAIKGWWNYLGAAREALKIVEEES